MLNLLLSVCGGRYSPKNLSLDCYWGKNIKVLPIDKNELSNLSAAHATVVMITQSLWEGCFENKQIKPGLPSGTMMHHPQTVTHFYASVNTGSGLV